MIAISDQGIPSELEGRVFRAAFKRKQALPKLPEVPIYLQFAYQAYCELATCRIYADGPIPSFAIYEWCDRNELDPEAAYNLRVLIDDVDVQMREYRAKKMKEAMKPKGKRKRHARR